MASDPAKTRPARYAIGMFGTSIPINMFRTYAAIYYVDKLGLSTAQFSLVLLIYTFIDAADNLVYGYLSDRTRTKWGRRRPWMVIGAPLLGLALIAFYNPPSSLSGNSLFGYFLLTYILTGTLDSLVGANYGALFPDLFQGDAERAVTNAMRQAFMLVAMIISIALTPMVTSKIGYPATALVYGILGVSVILYSVLGCHENPLYMETERPRLWDSLKTLLRNKKFWMAGFANAFYSAALALVMSSIPFYTKYSLKIPDSQSTILFASVLIIAIAAVAAWARLIKKFAVVPVWRAALIVLAVGFIPVYFADSLLAATLASGILGLGFGGFIVTMDLIGAKIIDEDSRKSGVRREAIYTSASGFMNRLNGLFTSLGFFLVFKIYGFKSGEVPGPNPGGAARFLLAAFPFVLVLFSCVFSRLLNFDSGKINKSQEV